MIPHVHVDLRKLQKARIDIPLEYECARCGLEMDVMVRGFGAARDTEAAENWAHKSAYMRCALWPCPHCGARDYTLWRREWIRMSVLILLAMAIGAVVWFIKDERAFSGYHQQETFIILGGVSVFFQLVVAVAQLYELRASKKAVRPRANDGTDGT